MIVHAIIAVRGGPSAKTRCASILTSRQRNALIVAMVKDMVAALAAVRQSCRVHIVTPTREIAGLAVDLGAEPIFEPVPAGVNAAFETARRHVNADAPDDRLILLPGDLPLITPDDVRCAILEHDWSMLGVVPANDGGTSALMLSAGMPIVPRFGNCSARAHRSAARAAGIGVATRYFPSFACDIDRPIDLEWLRDEASPSRAGNYLRSLGTRKDRVA